MIITAKTPDAFRTHLMTPEGEDLTRTHIVEQFNTETGEMFYRDKVHVQGGGFKITELKYLVTQGVEVVVDIDINQGDLFKPIQP